MEQELQFFLSYLRDTSLFDGDHLATAILVNNLPESYKIEWDKTTVGSDVLSHIYTDCVKCVVARINV